MSGKNRLLGALSRRSVPAGILTSATLFAIAFAVRALPWRTTFGEERVYLFGNDAYYHLRRILYASVQFPGVLDHDAYVAFPYDWVSPWPPFYDVAIALLTRPFAEPGDAAAIERIAVWIPVLLGAATVVVLHRLALRCFDSRVALAAALLLTVLSAHFWFSQIGFVDHHAAVAWLSTLLLASAMRWLHGFAERPTLRGAIWRGAFVTGILQAGSLLIWTGSLLHVGIVQAAFFAYLLARARRSDAIRFALAMAAMEGAALLGLLLGYMGRLSSGSFSMASGVPSALQCTLLGGAMCLSVGLAALWRATPAGRSRATRVASCLAIALLLAGVAAATLPRVVGGVHEAWSLFMARNPFMQSVVESSPLLVSNGSLDFSAAELRLSRLFHLVPILFVTALWWVRSQRWQAPLLLFLWWFAALYLATLVQLRFMNSFSPAFALIQGWGCVTATRWLCRHAGASRVRRMAVGSLVLLLLAAALQPMYPTYRHHLANQVAALAREPVLMTHRLLMMRSLIRLGGWLQANTPPTSGYLNASEHPEYGILSAWTIGHVLRYEARRPVVRDNFGTNLRVGRRYFGSRQRAANLRLERLKARYVVIQWEVMFEDPERILTPYPHTVANHLYFHDGSEVREAHDGRGLAAIGALERHRLVYESLRIPGVGSREIARFKVFEFVHGALVTGRTVPGTRVLASLRLRTNQDREFWYRATTVGDNRGRYALRLPYANRGAPPAVRPDPHYTLTCLLVRSARVVVGEEDVQEGREVPGPDLCL